MNIRRRKGNRPEARRVNGAITRYAKAMRQRAAIDRGMRSAQSCKEGYIAKGNKILAGKGRNGRTMNARLLLQHGIKRTEGGVL